MRFYLRVMMDSDLKLISFTISFAALHVNFKSFSHSRAAVFVESYAYFLRWTNS